MFRIYTFCDRTLVGKISPSAKLLSEQLYKLNAIISEVAIFPTNYDFSKLDFKNNEVYFLLLQKPRFDIASMLAEFCGMALKENEDLKNAVLEHYTKNNIILSEKSKEMWTIPENATPYPNKMGKVQGYMVKIGNSQVFVLPSDEMQLKAMLTNQIISYLEENFSNEYKSETYKTFGLDEPGMVELLKDYLKNKDNVFISTFSKGLDCNVIIKARSGNEKFEEYKKNIYSKIEKYIYSVTDLGLIDYCQKLIQSQNIKISFAGDLSINNLVSNFYSLRQSINECIIMPNVKSLYMYNSKERVMSFDAKTTYDIAVKLLERAETNICVVCFTNMDASQRGSSFIAVGNKLKIDIYKNKFMGTDEEIYRDVSSACLFYLIKRLQCNDLKTISWTNVLILFA